MSDINTSQFVNGEQCPKCKVKGLEKKMSKNGFPYYVWIGDKQYHKKDGDECKAIQERRLTWIDAINMHKEPLKPPADYVPSKEPNPERDEVERKKKDLYMRKDTAKYYSNSELDKNGIPNVAQEIEKRAIEKAYGKTLTMIEESVFKLDQKMDIILQMFNVAEKSFVDAKQIAEKQEIVKTPDINNTQTNNFKVTNIPIVDEIHEKIVDETGEDLDIVTEVYDNVKDSIEVDSDFDELTEDIPTSK